MDNTIRMNEHCVIGLPRCGYAFSSTRSCFIAYGFEESPLEMNLLRNILEDLGIEPVEAGGSLAPGQNTFCAKICSKIITSQFCIALVNNTETDGIEIPSANVSMEYGMMLGFNKYVIPFQRESQELPFNVAGLDTIKYDNRSFTDKATRAIEQAIRETEQEEVEKEISNQMLEMYLLSKNLLITNVQEYGERAIANLGSPLGFSLLNDFSGFKYVFLGQFSNLRAEAILWRVNKLNELLQERSDAIAQKLKLSMITEQDAALSSSLLENMEVLIITNNLEKEVLEKAIKEQALIITTKFVSRDEVNVASI